MNAGFTFEAQPFELYEEPRSSRGGAQTEQFLGDIVWPWSTTQTLTKAVAKKVPRSVGRGILPEKVCWIQNILNKTAGENLVEDGVFGPLTRAAVLRFQANHQLSVDGVVGSQTETALIQSALNQLAQASLVPVDGRLDSRTRQEIVRFQSANGLVADGVVGPKTRAAMVARLGGRCAIRVGTKKAPAPTDCSCTSELLEQARRQCRGALFDNAKACVLGDPIIATKVPHAADQIASQTSAQADTLESAASVFAIVVGIIRAIGILLTAVKIASIASCIWDQVRSYQGCVARIDACEQECRAKGLL